jgi:hypothetical protein
MKIEIDLSPYLGPGDAGALERLLAQGWSLKPEFGPVFCVRHRTVIANEPATKLIEFNGESWHGSGWEATLLWNDYLYCERRKTLAEAVGDIRDMVQAARSGDGAKFANPRFGRLEPR